MPSHYDTCIRYICTWDIVGSARHKRAQNSSRWRAARRLWPGAPSYIRLLQLLALNAHSSTTARTPCATATEDLFHLLLVSH
eukprot:6189203-Pleurochrysis_carterae.AAC.3